MANLDVIRRLSVELEVRGQDQAAAALKRFADAGGDISRAFGPVAETVDKTTKGFASAGDRAEQLERRLITSANATYNLGKALKALDTPGALDRLGPERFAATLSEALGRVPDIKARAEQMGQEFTRSFNESLRIGVKATDLGASFSALEEQLAKQEEIAKAHAAHIATISQQAIADLTGQNRPSAVSNGATFSGLTDLMRDLEAEEKRQQEQQRLIGQAVADSFWQGFSDRLRIGAKATEGGATFSALDEMMAKEEEIAKARGAHIAELSQRNIATLTGQNQSPATANGATFSALAEQAQQYDRQKRLLAEMLEKADPLGQEMKRLSEAQKTYNTALAEGEITQEQFVKLSEYSAQRIDVLSRNLGKDGLASGLKLSANQFQNLGYQINDVITMASMGASPFQILATQGGQVYQILAGARGGLAGGLAAVKDGFLKLLSPANIAMGALATGAVTAIYGWTRFHETLKEIDASLSGLGRTTLATTQQLNAVAEGAADSGGNVNRWQARSGVAALAATGRIDPSVYAEIVKQGQNYARLTGETLPEAQKELAASFANLPDALQKLQDRFNLFSASEQRSIELLWNSGNRVDAVRATLAKLNPVLADASQKVGGFAAFLDAATKKAVEYADRAGKVMAEAWAPNLEQQRQHLQNQIEQMGPRPTPNGGIFGNLFGNPADQRTAWDDQRSALQKQIDEIDRELDAFKKKHDDLTREGLASQLSQDIEGNIRKNIGTFGELTKQIEDTQAAMRQLDAQIANPSFPDMPEKDRKRALDARRAMTEAAPNLEIYRQYGGKEQFDAVQQAQRQVSMAGMTEFERGLAEIDARFNDAKRALIDSRPPLDELIAKEKALVDIRDAETEALKRQSALSLARQYAPDTMGLKDLQDTQDTFDKVGQALKDAGVPASAAAEIMERLKVRIDAYRTGVQRMQEDQALELKQIQALTLGERIAADTEKALTEARRQGATAAEQAAIKEGLRNKAIAEANKQAEDSLRSARDQASMIGMKPYQRALQEIENERSNALRQTDPNATRAPAGRVSVDDGTMRQIVAETVRVTKQIGVSPRDLLTVMGFETGGTFNPSMPGPVTKWGQMRGLIQMGEPQAAASGVFDFKNIAQQLDGIGKYLVQHGVQPGDDIYRLYAAINTGNANTGYKSDRAAGGTWGSADDKVRYQMQAHIEKADALLAKYAPGNDNSPDGDFISRHFQTQDVKSHAKEYSDEEASLKKLGVAYEYIQKPIIDANEAINEQMIAIRMQSSVIGGSTFDIAKMNEKLQLYADYARNGVEVTPQLAKAIEALGNKAGLAAVEQEKLNDTTQAIQDLKDTGKDALKGFIHDLEAGKSGAEALTNALQKVADKLLDMAIDGLFKGGGTGGGGLFNILGNLFGGGGGGMPIPAGKILDPITGGLFHTGGLVGGLNGNTRSVHPAYFAGAPRYHSGLRPDEVPAILQKGEWVLSRDDVSSIRNGGGGGAANQNAPRVTVINNGPTSASAKENPDGSIDVIVDSLENRMADRAARGRGALYKASTSRADGRALRG